MRIVVTGAAGFIGSSLSQRLLARGDEILGLDNLNDYYDVGLKRARLDTIQRHPGFSFKKLDIADPDAVGAAFKAFAPQRVVNLAAQAGVRYSIQNPYAYTHSNMEGFLSVLEACRHQKVEHLVYASSSSVYGANRKLPFSVKDEVNHPVSLYGATKRANELMAHAYSHLYSMPTTGLRFFTVYGPWGRPDMAPHLFTAKILKGDPIEVFNFGKHQRDFTYIDDIVEGITRVLDHPPKPDLKWDAFHPEKDSSSAPYRLFNIGNRSPVWLDEFISAIETASGRKANKKLLPAQPGDVLDTVADVASLETEFGFRPQTTIQEGMKRFVDWYVKYYQV